MFTGYLDSSIEQEDDHFFAELKDPNGSLHRHVQAKHHVSHQYSWTTVHNLPDNHARQPPPPPPPSLPPPQLSSVRLQQPSCQSSVPPWNEDGGQNEMFSRNHSTSPLSFCASELSSLIASSSMQAHSKSVYGLGVSMSRLAMHAEGAPFIENPPVCSLMQHQHWNPLFGSLLSPQLTTGGNTNNRQYQKKSYRVLDAGQYDRFYSHGPFPPPINVHLGRPSWATSTAAQMSQRLSFHDFTLGGIAAAMQQQQHQQQHHQSGPIPMVPSASVSQSLPVSHPPPTTTTTMDSDNDGHESRSSFASSLSTGSSTTSLAFHSPPPTPSPEFERKQAAKLLSGRHRQRPQGSVINIGHRSGKSKFCSVLHRECVCVCGLFICILFVSNARNENSRWQHCE